MFPLPLLGLLFISASGFEPPAEKTKEKESEEEPECHGGEKRKSKYDTIFTRGDLLEVPRTLFIHFGIYLGGDR